MYFPIRVNISGEIFLIQIKDYTPDFVFNNAQRILKKEAPTICYLDSDMTAQWITKDVQSLMDITKQWGRDKQSKDFVTLTEC
ncbi:hypothetical protein Ddc_20565 [Ditylenchus destructor]|nr:hypothetical protein Ddc_20565 [Ditylenchus destructor]